MNQEAEAAGDSVEPKAVASNSESEMRKPKVR